jgi:hypothetical protein
MGFSTTPGSRRSKRKLRTRLIDGDPTKDIRDLDKITTVIKAGNIYDPAAIEKALGIAPRKTGP